MVIFHPLCCPQRPSLLIITPPQGRACLCSQWCSQRRRLQLSTTPTLVHFLVLTTTPSATVYNTHPRALSQWCSQRRRLQLSTTPTLVHFLSGAHNAAVCNCLQHPPSCTFWCSQRRRLQLSTTPTLVHFLDFLFRVRVCADSQPDGDSNCCARVDCCGRRGARPAPASSYKRGGRAVGTTVDSRGRKVSMTTMKSKVEYL
jgi:hypothetical protein